MSSCASETAWAMSDAALDGITDAMREIHETADKHKTPAQFAALEDLRRAAREMHRLRIAINLRRQPDLA
jgi:hypothetical protein